jgi:transcriptional regulator with XRE-family HTH domain
MKRKAIPSEHREALNAISIYLRELRFSEGLTQLELSQQIKLHRNSIQRAETGHVTLLTIFKLATFYDISPTDIVSIID